MVTPLDFLFYLGLLYLIFSITAYFLARWDEKRRPYNAFTTGEEALKGINLSGKFALVTGASAGLGVETTRVLAKQGCTVFMACRNIAKAEKAKEKIIAALSDSKIENLKNKLIILKVDLASLQSVYDFCAKCVADGIHLDFLINNAGVMGQPKYGETKDGFEFQFGTNHLGHYYLTTLLLPFLKRDKTRIINLSSWAHRFGDYDKTEKLFDYCYKTKTFMGEMKNTYKPFYLYGISKSCNILFSRMLNDKYQKDGILSCAVHPGGINTELSRDIKVMDIIPIAIHILLRPWRIAQDFKDVQRGVSTTLRCVAMTDDEIKKSLYCYYENCCPMEPTHGSAARYGDNKMADKLWQLSNVLIESKGFPLKLKE